MELFLFVRAVSDKVVRTFVEDRASKNKEKHRLEWFIAAVYLFYFPEHADCIETQAGYRRLYDFQPEDFLHDRTTLQDLFGYSEADVGNATVDEGPPDHAQVPAPMDIYGRLINVADPEFARTYALMCRYPTRLIPDAMEIVADVMAEHATAMQEYPSTMVDFLSPIRFFQKITATMIKGVWMRKRKFRTEFLSLLTRTMASRREVTELMEPAHVGLQAICILNKERPGSKDRELIDAMIQNQLQAGDNVHIKESAREEIANLAKRVNNLWGKGAKLSSSDFLVQLSDCFDSDAEKPSHSAMVAFQDPQTKPKFHIQPEVRITWAAQGQDRKQPTN